MGDILDLGSQIYSWYGSSEEGSKGIPTDDLEMVWLYQASHKTHAFYFEMKFSRELHKGEAKPDRHHVLPDLVQL